GLRSALVSRVGDEQMGRFILEQLAREGVETAGVKTDPKRLTALVILGVRDETTFPLIFYRTDCADAALAPDDIDPDFIASARAIVVTGTHFAAPLPAEAQKKAIRVARAHGRKVVFDIDYRPNLWGLAGHAAGESRYIRSDRVTQHLQAILPDCDLVVGTEEELHIAGGSEDTLQAIRTIRALGGATIVCKRGPMGCVVFPGAIPDSLEDGIRGPGFPVEVYNVLGAGDAFLSGFLRGWLGGEALETACAWANACGAFAVSRLLCSPESPTFAELQFFLKNGSPHRALRRDEAINHVHWATTRRAVATPLMALAIDHRAQLEEMADAAGVPQGRIAAFKELAVTAAARVAAGRPGFGMLLDGTYGREALFRVRDHGFWVARPLEKAGSRPLALECEEAGALGTELAEWPVDHVAKCLCFYHPDDPEILRAEQEAMLLRVARTCRQVGRELLVEIIASRHGPVGTETVAGILSRFYALGIRPDWWKLEPQAEPAGWAAIDSVIAREDPWCRGVLLLGLDAPEAALAGSFRLARGAQSVRGFAVGRTIFAQPARDWLAGLIDDDAAIAAMATGFSRLVAAWAQAEDKA
ncbi:MAG: 5-dehydro-2-deoxygluconokinase, partial [Beijerinckiaceae bacterium]|nr:5-dehydro-2-deoxygluconokinase [Beijerinckiaceae bacterium]